MTISSAPPARVEGKLRGAGSIGSWIPPDQESSTSVAKALALLSSFGPQHLTMGVSEIARRAQLPKSTAHRLLSVLVDWEMVTKRGTAYSPGSRLSELAALAAHPETRDLRRVALPHMLDLYEMTHETVNLCVLVGCDTLYIEKIHGHHSGQSPAQVGSRLPAANTAVGKVLLAFSDTDVIARVSNNLRPATSSSISSATRLTRELAAIQRSGLAYDRQEARPGLTCIAAPVRTWAGAVVAAVSISGPVHRFQPATAAPAVRAAAAGIAKLAQQASWHQQPAQ